MAVENPTDGPWGCIHGVHSVGMKIPRVPANGHSSICVSGNSVRGTLDLAHGDRGSIPGVHADHGDHSSFHGIRDSVYGH